MTMDKDIQAKVAAALKRIDQIGFSKINKKLQFDDPKQWTDDRIAEAERAYKRFLALNLLYPEETLAVNRIIDEYWHAHILDTRKYAEDCESIFGKLLHHYPYFGLPGEEDEGENVPALAVTEEIWEQVFGTSILDRPAANPRLTLDRILGGLDRADDGPDGGPKGCKNGQHCKKIIAPSDLVTSRPIVAVEEAALKK